MPQNSYSEGSNFRIFLGGMPPYPLDTHLPPQIIPRRQQFVLFQINSTCDAYALVLAHSCLLCSSAVSSCTHCIDPSFKLQRDLLQADLPPGESKMRHNGVQVEQITP